MFTIAGRARSGYCDGVTRRDFLKIGGLALGGMSLPQLLRAEDQAGITRSHKAVIMVFLAGGPPHQDMFDLKPDAPEGIRGEYRPIATNVPGLDICEHMPRLAKMMDKFAVIRSVVGAGGDHSAGPVLDRLQGLDQQSPGRAAEPGSDRVASPGAGSPRCAAVCRALAPHRRTAMGQPRRSRLPGPGPRAVHAVSDRDETKAEQQTGPGRRGLEPGRQGDHAPAPGGPASLLGQIDDRLAQAPSR